MMHEWTRGTFSMHFVKLSRNLARLAATRSVARRRSLVAVTLVLLVAVVAACGTATPRPTSAVVSRGSVARTVSATGTLQAITEQKLGFETAGKLTELLVSVGQHVEAGQVLARIDDFDARADLERAQAELAREQAVLDRIRDGNKADAAHHDSDEAKKVLGATKDQADEVDSANGEAIDQTEQRLDENGDRLREARSQAEEDQNRCNRSVTGNSHRYDGYGDYGDVKTKNEKGLLFDSPLDVHSPACERAERGKAAVSAYQRRIESDRAALAHLERRQKIDRAEQDVAVANAHREASSASDAAHGTSSDRPHDIDEQTAIVSVRQTRVRRAQRDVDNTVLLAPVAGIVASISGTVGEYVGAAAGTTPLAPGSRASLPDMESGTSTKDESGNKAQRPGGGAFLTLKDVNSFQVVAPFEEADAAQIRPNQKVDVVFDAVPGLIASGTVSAVAPTGAQIQDVTNYYVTVVLNAADPRLRGGLTAEANVVVGTINNVLVVPTAAVQRGGDTGVVQVLAPDGTTKQAQVQLGLVGDRTTQILAGLKEGDRVAIAQ